MNVNFRSFLRLAFMLGLPLSLTTTLAAQSETLNGVYGFVLNASYTNPSNQGGAAMLGLADFNKSGGVSGSYTLELGSGGSGPLQTLTGTFTGTYTLTSGSGSMTVTLSDGTSLTIAILLTDKGSGLELIATNSSGDFDLSQSVVSGIGGIAGEAVLNNSFSGQLIYSPQITKANVLMSFKSGGRMIFLFAPYVEPGQSPQNFTFSGTYTEGSRGEGIITLAATQTQGVQTFLFVATEEGVLLMQLNRSGNGVAFGVAPLLAVATQVEGLTIPGR
jgi:hypothetical protein